MSDIVARMAKAALRATASNTAIEILAKLKTVDGVGSGLDADMVGGHLPSDFSLVLTAEDILALLLTVDGAASTLDADLIDGYHASDMPISGGVWT